MKTYTYDDGHLSPGEWTHHHAHYLESGRDNIDYKTEDDCNSVAEDVNKPDARAICQTKNALRKLWMRARQASCQDYHTEENVITGCSPYDPEFFEKEYLSILLDAGVVRETTREEELQKL